jgi:hypothetical protein
MTQASIPTRLGRYSDWTPLKPLCTSGSLAGKRPFYAGPNVEARMSLVRDAINHVRINWDKYPAFLLDLRSFLEAKGLDLREGGDPSRMLSGLLSGLRGGRIAKRRRLPIATTRFAYTRRMQATG